ncbi:hypothetical protein ACSQ76_14005 [Roseovarius sp. B08]|uniref:hypothetical protein n=1 Tax=Roseovarius sp. B08 TaxID=3449223 RepID=UPI003EDB78D3
MRNTEPSEAAMLAELERLADTSPHLMVDLGFRETRTGPPGVTTWRRGFLRVVRDPGTGARHHAFRVPRV